MNTKLTIKLDKYLIVRAKEYTLSQNRSLSKLIESYLNSLLFKDLPNDNEEIQISQFVKSLSSGINIPVAIDYKNEYST